MIQNIGWQDIVDILLLTFIFYRLFTLVKGTRTIPILAGFSLVLAVYLISQTLHLEAIGLLLDNLANSLVLVLVILFHTEIRNVLAQFGLITFFIGGNQYKKDVLDEVIRGANLMAQERMGALVVFEREMGLRNFIEKGTAVDAVLSKELLLSIFRSSSPLHDGAVVVDRKGRLAAAGCILPISTNTEVSPIFGTRHRAAMGLTEETDAVVLVVSEERSEISLSYKGELIQASSDTNIKKLLFELMEVKAQELPKDKGEDPLPEVVDEDDKKEVTAAV
ncbi:MAG: TIGR00159 family protein [SAR324 cluster bacterium]|nr:TIGR00159 family protein [SAR324 cluster bacterium]